MKPKGQILLIGGAEDIGCENQRLERQENITYEEFEILKRVKNASKNSKVDFITSGTREPESTHKRYEEAFAKLGLSNPCFLYIDDKDKANDKAILDIVEKADVIFFTGGDQARLAKILLGTKVNELIKNRYQEDEELLIAGTSAGAMFLAKIMIESAPRTEVLLNHKIKLSEGMGLLENCIIDTHFIKRERFSRLMHAVATHPESLGIGLGEDTAILIKNGTHAQCIGSGMVVLINAHTVTKTNIATVKDGEPIYIENLRVDILTKGCQFLLNN